MIKKYLVAYAWRKADGKKQTIENVVTDTYPVFLIKDFVDQARESNSGETYVLINFWEISEEDYEDLKETFSYIED